MSVVQYKKYFWLVDTIRSAGKITKEQIDRKWSSSRYNDSHWLLGEVEGWFRG